MNSFYRGKLVLVVGGTQGIGLAVARQLERLGARLCLVARNEARLAEVCRSLAEARGIPLDVVDRRRTLETLGQEMERNGVFDIVINCAGLARPGYLNLQEDEDIRQMMEVNYFGTYHVCKAVLQPMLEQGRGIIANTASLGGLMGLFGYAGYCASKYAVIGFSEALRREVKPFGLTVCVLCPPNTDTPGLATENLSKPPEVLALEESVSTVSADLVASKLLKALPRGKKLIIPTLDGWMAYYLSRYAPFVLERFLKRPEAP